jgi:hypothetical protein
VLKYDWKRVVLDGEAVAAEIAAAYVEYATRVGRSPHPKVGH